MTTPRKKTGAGALVEEPATAADKAPKGRGGSRQGAGRPRKSLAPELEAAIGGVALLVVPINQADGMTILEGAPRLAEALDRLAQQNPKVRRVIERALATSVYGDLFMALAPIVLGIMANHGLLPSEGLFTAPAAADPPTPAEANGSGATSPS